MKLKSGVYQVLSNYLRFGMSPTSSNLTLTPNGDIRGQPQKVAMFGIKLKVFMRT